MPWVAPAIHPDLRTTDGALEMRGSAPTNLTGYPGVSIPCGLDVQGMPVGLHIACRANDDALTLSLGAAFEALQPNEPS